MQVTIQLSDMFSYSLWPIIIFFLLIVIYILILRKKKDKKIKEDYEILDLSYKDINYIRKKYLKKINELEDKVNNKQITNRKAYLSLSAIVRNFVHEMTGIKVHKYTLKDIKKLNMPQLTMLVEEYYHPEFAEYSLGNIKESISKTRKVIEKWH